MKRIASVLLICLLLAGCSEPAAMETQPETIQPQVQTEDTTALRLTQESNVRKATYEGKDAYSDFLAAAEPLFLIPGLKQVLTPQGIAVCPTTGRTYISAYSVDGVPSAVTVMEAQTNNLVAEYYLYNSDGTPFTSHVGGVAVTETHMYLSAKLDNDGSYRIAAIALADLPAEGAHNITLEETIPMAMSPSMMNYSGGYLWVGNFYHPGADYGLSAGMDYTTENAEGEKLGSYIMGYDMTGGDTGLTVAAGDSYAQPDVVLAAPNKIQGVVVKDGTVTLSQSYGRKNNACLLRYALALDEAPDTALTVNGREVKAYLLDSARQTAALTVMPMTEALTDAPDGGIYVLFESGATHYANGTYRTDHVWKVQF